MRLIETVGPGPVGFVVREADTCTFGVPGAITAAAQAESLLSGARVAAESLPTISIFVEPGGIPLASDIPGKRIAPRGQRLLTFGDRACLPACDSD